jgi:hypothetical protein
MGPLPTEPGDRPRERTPPSQATPAAIPPDVLRSRRSVRNVSPGVEGREAIKTKQALASLQSEVGLSRRPALSIRVKRLGSAVGGLSQCSLQGRVECAEEP